MRETLADTVAGINLRTKPATKGWTLHNSICVKSFEQPFRDRMVVRQGPGQGVESCLVGIDFSLGRLKKALEMDGGDDSTTV